MDGEGAKRETGVRREGGRAETGLPSRQSTSSECEIEAKTREDVRSEDHGIDEKGQGEKNRDEITR